MCIFKQLVVHNRAVDGKAIANWKKNSCSHTANKADSPWLVIDLEHSYKIMYVKILNRADWFCGK